MHAIGVYIMPPPRGGTNIPRSQNMMYRVPRHDVPTTSALCIGFADIVDGKNTVCYYKSMKKDLLSELSLVLAELCVNLAKELQKKKEYNFADQIKRSATSVAANVAEAGHPQSRADMISKFEIALKEAFETGRWLQMLKDAALIDENTFSTIDKKCTKIRVLLIASIRTLKSKV